MPDETQVSSELVGGEGAMEAQIEMASTGASDFDVASPTPTDDEAEEFAERLVRRAASLSMVKINRGTFLRTEIPKYCPDIDAQLAVETTPAEAGVPSAVLDRIAQDALPAPNGGKFWKLLDLSMIDFEKDTTFPNWSHGTTGTAWMFAALYQDTKKEEYLELAKEGLTYAMNIAVGDETGRLIPYQDHPVTGPTYDKYYLSTCHGPVGSTLAFRELYEITGEEIYRNWTIELSRGIVRAGAPEKHSWGFWNCQCQCCGTAGILEHFAAMYEYTGEKEFYDYMIRTADVMLSDSDHRTPGLRTWYDSWWRTIPTRVVSYPGLYVGVAGCASSLLRTYAALTGKKLTNLYEYHFFEKF